VLVVVAVVIITNHIDHQEDLVVEVLVVALMELHKQVDHRQVEILELPIQVVVVEEQDSLALMVEMVDLVLLLLLTQLLNY
tara:strand:+ start:130 stop:372 length:243 start_codon:yes stop_codon:yes gene_type:complete